MGTVQKFRNGCYHLCSTDLNALSIPFASNFWSEGDFVWIVNASESDRFSASRRMAGSPHDTDVSACHLLAGASGH
jgi:hypothetical protein